MDEVRARILEGGTAVLRERGVDGFSLEIVAEFAGVSRKTIYNHFGSRFSLLDTIFSGAVEHAIEGLATIASDPALDFVSKLNSVAERGFHEVSEGSLMFRSTGSQGRHPRSSRMYREIRKRLAGFILGIVGEQSARALLRQDVDPRRLTYVVINMVEGLLFLEDVEEEPFSRLEILQESLRMLLEGILSPEGAAALQGSPLLARREATP